MEDLRHPLHEQGARSFQIPPDFVVKAQVLDIVEVIS